MKPNRFNFITFPFCFFVLKCEKKIFLSCRVFAGINPNSNNASDLANLRVTLKPYKRSFTVVIGTRYERKYSQYSNERSTTLCLSAWMSPDHPVLHQFSLVPFAAPPPSLAPVSDGLVRRCTSWGRVGGATGGAVAFQTCSWGSLLEPLKPSWVLKRTRKSSGTLEGSSHQGGAWGVVPVSIPSCVTAPP